MGEVWVYIEVLEGKSIEGSLELLGKGKELAEKLGVDLAGVLIGSQVQGLAEELFSLGASKAYVVENENCQHYQSGPYAKALTKLTENHSPDIILFAATSVGSELAARTAAKLKTGLTAHCMDLYIDDETNLLVQVVPGYGGNIIVKNICPEKRPQMATVRTGVSKKPEPVSGASGEIVSETIEFDESDFRARTTKFISEVQEAQAIESADVVVSFGYGVQTEEDFALIKQLAEALGEGTAIGGTRPVVDEGWITEKEMVGQSGVFISPKLYFAIGISGAMHHNVGVMDGGYIVAINKDPKAEIFEIADLGIVGDLSTVLPPLIEEIKNRS
jgi:electron transfer flavoprotein alpha subunit